MFSKRRVLLTLFFVATMILSVAPVAVVSASPVMEIPPNLKRIELTSSINGEMGASQVLALSLDPDVDDYYELLNLKWNVPVDGVSYVINPTEAPEDSSVEVEAAFEAWDAEVSIELYSNVPEIDYGADPSTRRPDYKNVVSWGRLRGKGVVAMASIWYDVSTVIDGNYLIVDADIIFNTLQPWGIDPDGEGSESLLNAFDVRNVGTHEVGHLCGLGDIYDGSHSELTMYGYTDLGEVKRISLGLGDKLGVQKMYGSGDPGDTTPPAQVTGLEVNTVSSSQLDLAWTENTESDLDHYKVYRSSTSGSPYDLVASPTTNEHSDTGLSASTTYYYIVTAVDTSGNEGVASDESSGTTSEGQALPAMHVASIDMSTGIRTAGRNRFVWAIATVTIVDAEGVPVPGATVYGYWEDATTDSDSGVTDADGVVRLRSDSIRNPPDGSTFTFVVDNVVLSGWDYDSAANVKTSGSIEV